MLETTTVGSFPKPDALKAARAAARRGQLDPAQLRQAEEQATRECLALQEQLGLDILVDGEMYRGDMATYFAEHLEGFTISSLVRSYGNRYYRKPIATQPIRWTRPITVDWYRFAAGLTQRPVKGMLTGPYTMMDWSFNEAYPTRRALALALAQALHEEVKALEAAGARYIQIDEPAVSTRPEEIALAVETMRIVTDGIRAKTITHICYGNFEQVYPQMLELAVDQIDLELANSQYELLTVFRNVPFTKEIGLGVLDVHSHTVESVPQIKQSLARALEVFEPARIMVDPDCGLKTRTLEECRAKLANMVTAVREFKQERGLAKASAKQDVHSVRSLQ